MKLQQAAYYNLGNVHYHLGEAEQDLDSIQKSWETAVKSYQNALALDKDDADAKFNLQFVKQNIQYLIQLRALAHRLKAEADEATRQRKYHQALQIMEKLFQNKNPLAQKFEEFTKKLKDIDDIATPPQP